MADLGDFTAAVREKKRAGGEVDTFTFFGERFAVVSELNDGPLLDLAAASMDGTDSATMEGLAALRNFIRGILVEDTVRGEGGMVLAEGWPRFHALCSEKKVDSRDLLELVQRLVPLMTGRPTTPPSDSPKSPSSTSQPSKSESDAEREARARWERDMATMLPVEAAAAALASSG